MINNRKLILNIFLLLLVFNIGYSQSQEEKQIDLSGEWAFQIDSLDVDIK